MEAADGSLHNILYGDILYRVRMSGCSVFSPVVLSVIAKSTNLLFDDGITDIISDAKNYETFHDEYIFNRFESLRYSDHFVLSRKSLFVFSFQGRHTMNLTKEEQIILKHYHDLINLSYQRSIPAYSQFGSMSELELAYKALDEFYGHQNVSEEVQYKLYGGYPEAERKIICFLPDDRQSPVVEQDFPIACIRFLPANKKFCDELNHRDYLGTIMGLGITRDRIGDILVKKDPVFKAGTAYAFCKKDMVPLLEGITRIKHTTVVAKEVAFSSADWKITYKTITGSVSSFRLDAILALAIRTSRSQTVALIQSGKVFLNGRICTENAKKLEEGDIFSIRGYGKFRYDKANAISKKGRYHITVQQYT